MHGVAPPESASRKPSVLGEDFHDFQGHRRARWPRLFVPVLAGYEIYGRASGVERWEGAAAHWSVLIDSSELGEGLLSFGDGRELLDDGEEGGGAGFVDADGADGFAIVFHTEAGDDDVDEVGFIPCITVGFCERFLIGMRDGLRAAVIIAEVAEMKLAGGDGFRSPEAVRGSANAFLHLDDFAFCHSRMAFGGFAQILSSSCTSWANSADSSSSLCP